MKALLMGCGGIGSHFSDFVASGIRNHTLDVDLSVADGDTVEAKNLLYSKFDVSDVGNNKAEAIGSRYVFDSIPKYIKKQGALEAFDLVILATDDGKSRKMVFESDKEWIDMRGKGSGFAVFTKGCKKTDEMLKTIDIKRPRESCQYENRLEQKQVDAGNIISAAIGYQMLINMVRYGKNSVKEFRGLL